MPETPTAAGDLTALASLAARVCPWAASAPGSPPGDGDDDGDGPVWAMPLVLRIERATPPGTTALLEAGARAAVALCLDPRAAPGGDWFDAVSTWAGAGRIRKVARRARTSHWRAVDGVDGLTATVGDPDDGGAQVRALVPGPVDDVPHEVRRLQIGGTDLPGDDPGPPPSDRPVIWLNPGVAQSTGKAAAQVGHASMILATVLAWTAAGPDEVAGTAEVAVRVAARDDWTTWSAVLAQDPSGRDAWERHGIAPVRDAGFTEVAPGTVTCLAQRSVGR